MAEGKDLSARRADADRATEGLRQRIESEREALDQTLDQLSGRVHQTLDWRRQLSQHRGALLAAGGGLVLAGLWRRRRRRRDPMERLQATVARAADRFNDQVQETFGAFRRHVTEPRRPGLFRRLLVPLAVAAVRQALSQRGDSSTRAEAGRPTPADAPQRGDSAGWKQEDEWNRESSSTIGA
jgi:hypothetical protein